MSERLVENVTVGTVWDLELDGSRTARLEGRGGRPVELIDYNGTPCRIPVSILRAILATAEGLEEEVAK